ncbi:hypothetical protein KBD45_07410 [Candidatus Dojkabacteria bacterium]|nr:hypothetical protein [Candidatus Dojkabacteria bacterium]
MFEGRSLNLIQQSEALALQEIGGLSNISGEVFTKKEIIERIKDINKNIAMYDLVIESDTFSKLISVTNQNFPRVKDRIYSATLFLFSKLDDKLNHDEILENIQHSTTLIFSWDKLLSERILETIEDFKNFIHCKEAGSTKKCTQELIKKYKFRNDLYNFANEEVNKNKDSSLRDDYLGSIAYIENIGPLASLYETFKSDNDLENKKFDILISLIKFTINQLKLDSFSIPHIIPSLLRSIVRKNGHNEAQILSMKINEIIHIANKDIVGKKIIDLASAIAAKDQNTLTSSISGERLYFELLFQKFWDKLEHLPELSLLEYISKISQIDTPEDDFDEKPKLYSKAGELSEILYGD